MNKKPKLQDSLEIFMEELTATNKSLASINDLYPKIHNKVQEFKNHHIKVNADGLKEYYALMLENMDANREKIHTLLNDFLEENTSILEEQKKGRIRLYIHSFLYVLISSLAFYFAINSHLKQERIEQELTTKQRHMNTLKSYIHETNQEGRFKKWLKNN